MKKLLALFTAVVMLLSVGAVTAYAENGKIDSYLAVLLTKVSETDKLNVFVDSTYMDLPTKDEISAKIAEATDLDPENLKSTQEVRDYYKVWRSVHDELTEQSAKDGMEKLELTFDDIYNSTGYDFYTPENIGRKGMPRQFSLTKAQIERLAQMDEVTKISYIYPTGEIPNPYDKMSDSLARKLAEQGDGRIGVWAWVYGINEATVDRLIRETYGEEISWNDELYHQAKLTVSSDYYSHSNQEIVDRLNVAKEDQMFVSSLTPSFNLYLTKDQVLELLKMPEVASADFYETGFYVPEGAEKYCDMENPLFERFMSWGNANYGRGDKPVSRFAVLYSAEDWSIIKAHVGFPPPWEVKCGGIIGNRFLYSIGGYEISLSGYFLYDAKEDEFYSLTKVDANAYKGLLDAIEELNLGLRLGDVDQDGEISIYDATMIQRVLADLDSFGMISLDSKYNENILGDYNCDGNCDVFDATAIQRMLAGL